MNSEMIAAFAMRIGELSFPLGTLVQELSAALFLMNDFSITTSYGMVILMSIFSYVFLQISSVLLSVTLYFSF